ncbi:MAG: glucokinase [Pseudomonadota bacterium]|nr:glucokinase [Pseudomonadota bacterium]
MTRYILAGDIGGTKTLLQLAAAESDAIDVVLQKSYASTDHEDLSAIVDTFLRDAHFDKQIAAACFAVAGPVIDGRARLTNLPWHVNANEIASRFAIARVELINDFAAVGLGLARLSRDDLLTLQEGRPQRHGVRAAIGAGTGLGVTFLTWSSGRYIAHASEGGHADFAPANDLQQRLLQHLRQRHGHVSCERVLSGPGLIAAYEFLCVHDGYVCDIDVHSEHAAAQIAARAGSDAESPAARALDLFVDVYGAYAGSLALTMLASGGIYIAGGIAPKISARLGDGRFLKAFLDKGRYAELLSKVPIHVVMNAEVGLIGAAAEAVALT